MSTDEFDKFPTTYDCNKKIDGNVLTAITNPPGIPGCFIELMALNDDLEINVPLFRSRWAAENITHDCRTKVFEKLNILNPGNDNNIVDQMYKKLAVASSWLLNNYFCILPPNRPLLVEPGSPTNGWSDTTKDLFNFFSDKTVFGIGNLFLSTYCFYLHRDTDFNNKLMFLNPVYDNWCGCFNPPKLNIKDFDENVSPYCNYACSNGQTLDTNPIQLFYFDKKYTYIPEDQIETNDNLPIGTDLRQITCQTLVCIIDIGIINILYSKNITINFNQICNTCSSRKEACMCIVDVTTAATVDRAPGFQNSVNINIDCGNYVCVEKIAGKDGEYGQIECTEENLGASSLANLGINFGFLEGDGIGEVIKSKEWTLLIFIFIFMIVFFILPGIYSLFKIKIKIRQE